MSVDYIREKGCKKQTVLFSVQFYAVVPDYKLSYTFQTNYTLPLSVSNTHDQSESPENTGLQAVL